MKSLKLQHHETTTVTIRVRSKAVIQRFIDEINKKDTFLNDHQIPTRITFYLHSSIGVKNQDKGQNAFPAPLVLNQGATHNSVLHNF